LDIFGVQQDVVAEVRKEEVEAQVSVSRPFFDPMHFRRAEQAVIRWAQRRYSAVEVQENVPNGPDILILDDDDENVGIEVLIVRGPNPARVMHRVRELAYRGHWHRERLVLTVFAIAVVADDSASAQAITQFLKRRKLDLPETHLHVGFIATGEEFEEVEEIRL
jgi:hypothetical protein